MDLLDRLTEEKKLMTLTKAPSSEKDLLSLILEDAQQSFMDFTNRSEVPVNAYPLVRKLAVIYYQRYKDGEGISSKSQGDVSVSYSTDIPSDIKSRLYSYRKLKCCRFGSDSK